MTRRTDNGPRKLKASNLAACAFRHQNQIQILRESIYNTLREKLGMANVLLSVDELRVTVADCASVELKSYMAFADTLWTAEKCLIQAQGVVTK